ncbi:alpha/beta fold hydrolase [Streptosporangium sandarakinum]|uniref:Medium-chain acyl-[acyl-carrier-protein] hydrolase n=1 Tax=Streptosporangium sandarakinum TaxID=1260955 RepID=A0A852UMT2_9ACTN|nr:thioesterase [Streptosporangium sandarakinum]NYF38637.1 medium-chain acyl-[acyl-carrier-protein] hydrolase [Streptosporangium sandarakinum]
MTAPWFVPVGGRPEGRVRLYAFPNAGGGPASLTGPAAAFPPEVEVWSVNLPGRQARLAEPPRDDLDGLVEDLARDLLTTARPPYALFGYCSGALLAYLVCRRLTELSAPGGPPPAPGRPASGPSPGIGRPASGPSPDAGSRAGSAPGPAAERPILPERLLVGSFAAPDVALLLRRLPSLPSWLFWEQLIELGGVPAEVAEREALRPILEPALRADFGMLAGYRHVPAPPLPVPITVLYGGRDRSVSRGGLLGWRRQSVHRPSLRELDASHWLAEEAPDRLAAAITEEIGCVWATA